jgi:hypothetical protein
MEVSSRQIIALAAPLVITYLTYSTVGGQLTTLRKLTANAAGSTSSLLRPEIAPLARNPFAPATDGPRIDPGLLAAAEDGEEAPKLRLDGTVVAGRWRMAIINGQRVFEGQVVGMMRVQSVSTDAVTLLGPGGETVELTLDIAPAAPVAKAGTIPPGKAPPGSAPASGGAPPSPIEVGIEALKNGGAAGDVLESLGIPRS